MNLSWVAKSMIRTISVCAVILIVAGAVFYRSLAAVYFAVGAALGCGLNICKVILLERAIEKAVEMESGPAANYIRLQYLLRFLLTGVVLTVAALCPYVNLWGAAAGILTLQIAAIGTKFSRENQDDPDHHS